MKFNKLYQNILTEMFSQYKYKTPKDKQYQLFDFYLLTGLPIPTNENLKESYNDALQEITSTLVSSFKDALFQATCCEFRHFFDIINYNNYINPMRHIPLYNYTKETLSPAHTNFLKRIIKYYEYNEESSYDQFYDQDSYKSPVDKFMTPGDEQDNWLIAGRDFAYRAINRAIDKTSFTEYDFMEYAKTAFAQVDITAPGYGGNAWAAIADGYLKLDDAQSVQDKIIWIDHTYDLQHNNDTVFNKLKEYYRPSTETDGFYWLLEALDKKFKIKNLYEIINDVSPELKTFAMAVIKDTSGNSYEFWMYKKDKYKDNQSQKIQKLKRTMIKKQEHKLKVVIDDKENLIKTFKKDTSKLHNDLGPAVIGIGGDNEGEKQFWIDGELHRENGPAIITSDGERFYYQHGWLHNPLGPAVNTKKEESYYLKGKIYSAKRWAQAREQYL